MARRVVVPPAAPPATVHFPRPAVVLLSVALLLPPLVVLSTLTAVYSLTPLACGMQSSAPLHAALAAGMTVCALLAMSAVWQRLVLGERIGAASEPGRTDAFMANCGIGVSAFCTLSIATMWIAPALLLPCSV